MISPDGAATEADLDLAYAVRGSSILDCDTARATLLDVRVREHAAQDAWWADRATRRLPAWRRFLRIQ